MTNIKHRHFLKFKLLFYTIACFADTSKAGPSVQIDLCKNINIGQGGVINLRTTENVEPKSEFPFQTKHEI